MSNFIWKSHRQLTEKEKEFVLIHEKLHLLFNIKSLINNKLIKIIKNEKIGITRDTRR